MTPTAQFKVSFRWGNHYSKDLGVVSLIVNVAAHDWQQAIEIAARTAAEVNEGEPSSIEIANHKD